MRRPGILAALIVLAAAAGPNGAPAAPGIVLVAPQPGALLHGAVSVIAQTASEVGSVEFAWSRGWGTGWQYIALDADPSDGWTALWRTGAFTGKALVRATASDGGTTTVPVWVDNTPPALRVTARPEAFSPNFDDVLDRVRVSVRTERGATLAVEIRDRHGRAVFAAQARESVWDGSGVADGTYTIRARAADAAGNVGETSVRVVVDTTAPAVSWRLLRDRYRSGERLRFVHWARDRGPVHVEARVLDGPGAPGGRLPTRPGVYHVVLVAQDPAGNRTVTESRPVLVEGAVHTRVYRRAVGGGRRVALTFDDCNDAGAWGRILGVLDRADVRAAFFCTGGNVLAHEAVARRTAVAGHVVGSHGWDHRREAGLGVDAVRTRLERDLDAWWGIARVSTAPWFRPPYGSYDADTLAGASAVGYARTVLWDVDPWDWSGIGAGTIAARVLSHARPGSVVLLHVLRTTAEALPAILAGLERQHLEPVGLAELFERRAER